MNSKLKPALIGGLVAGVLSVIPFVATCSCLWAIGGGVIGGYLFIEDSATPVSVGNGALVGVLVGVVAGLIRIIIGIPVSLALASNAGLEQQLRHAGIQLPFSSTVLFVLAGIAGAVFIIGLATVGGLISVPLFEKRKRESDPPPPPIGFAA
jgi:hypothetical protein